MLKGNIVLTEGQIEHIINGGEVTIKLPENGEIIIRQSLVKDVAAPVINNPMRVVNVHLEERRRNLMSSINDSFKPGS